MFGLTLRPRLRWNCCPTRHERLGFRESRRYSAKTIGCLVNNWFTPPRYRPPWLPARSTRMGFLLCQQRLIDVVGDPDAARLGE
jgi:hypothetical protein